MSTNKAEQDKENKHKTDKAKNSASTSKCVTENNSNTDESSSKSNNRNEKFSPSAKSALQNEGASRNGDDLNNHELDSSSMVPELDKRFLVQAESSVSLSSFLNHPQLSSQNLHPSSHSDFPHENNLEIGASNAAGQYSPDSEPIHMTLEEVRNSLSSQHCSAIQLEETRNSPSNPGASSSAEPKPQLEAPRSSTLKDCLRRTFYPKFSGSVSTKSDRNTNKRKSFPTSLKFNLKGIFNIKKSQSVDSSVLQQNLSKSDDRLDWSASKPSHSISNPSISPFNQRSLPPVPVFYPGGEIGNPEYDQEARAFMASVDDGFILNNTNGNQNVRSSDFAASIEKVKDCGWYWGPVNGEVAEKLLSTEPDGSFIVRDSSDEHYIFSLTFKLNGLVRHVRIEHDQGNFSFGSLQKFKSTTIVDFIENAVEHSRSGRYLFFLHRRPVLGPMRVQLLHPLSRFKHVQSLQHQCRFVILKHVRRDFIGDLLLPQRLKDYLSYPNYYSEKVDFLCEPENGHIDHAGLLNFDNAEIVGINSDLDPSQNEPIPGSANVQRHTYHENSEVDSEHYSDNSRNFQTVNMNSLAGLDEENASGTTVSSSLPFSHCNTDMSQIPVNSNNFLPPSDFHLPNNKGLKSDTPEDPICNSPMQENVSNFTNSLEAAFTEANPDGQVQINDANNLNNCQLSTEAEENVDVNLKECNHNSFGSSLSVHFSDDEVNPDAHYEQLKKNDSNFKSLDLNVGENVDNKQLEYLDPQHLNLF